MKVLCVVAAVVSFIFPYEAVAGEAVAKAMTDDCVIMVSDAIVEEVPLKNPITEKPSLSEKKYLQLVAVIGNLSDSRKIDYQGAGFNRFVSHATLKDDLGNSYKAVTFGIYEVATQTKETSIYPGKSARDLYVFEPPVANAKTLTLTIEGEAIGSKDKLRLSIRLPKPKAKPKVAHR